MDRPAARSSQTDCALNLVAQICRRTNLQLDIYRRAIVAAEAQGRPDHVRDLRRFLGMQRQDRELLRKLIERMPGPRVSQRPRCAGGDRARSPGGGDGQAIRAR